MSTAGKVLIVLVLLVLPVWIILVSAVAELNSEWTQELAKQNKQIETLDADIKKNEAAIVALQDKIDIEQFRTREDEALLQARLSDYERARTELVRIDAGIKVQLATMATAVAKAELAKESRAKEQVDETKGLADARSLVDELKAANSELLSELTQLREEFKSLLDSNKKSVNQLIRESVRPTTRSASFVR